MYNMNLNEQRQESRDLFTYTVFVLSLCVIFLLTFQSTIVRQTSMSPTYEDGDYLLCTKTYGVVAPERGNVVIFKAHMDVDGTGVNDVLLIKRVIAIPGDRVKVEAGQTYVNDFPIYEDYIGANYNEDFEEVIVPESTYFCMGDNRDESVDSRLDIVGFVNRSDIRGIVLFKLFPSKVCDLREVTDV